MKNLLIYAWGLFFHIKSVKIEETKEDARDRGTFRRWGSMNRRGGGGESNRDSVYR